MAKLLEGGFSPSRTLMVQTPQLDALEPLGERVHLLQAPAGGEGATLPAFVWGRVAASLVYIFARPRGQAGAEPNSPLHIGHTLSIW